MIDLSRNQAHLCLQEKAKNLKSYKLSLKKKFKTKMMIFSKMKKISWTLTNKKSYLISLKRTLKGNNKHPELCFHIKDKAIIRLSKIIKI